LATEISLAVTVPAVAVFCFQQENAPFITPGKKQKLHLNSPDYQRLTHDLKNSCCKCANACAYYQQFMNVHAQALGRLGGKAGTGKAKARTSEQARTAAMVRWNKPGARKQKSEKEMQ
jgi:hypothetical protein